MKVSLIYQVWCHPLVWCITHSLCFLLHLQQGYSTVKEFRYPDIHSGVKCDILRAILVISISNLCSSIDIGAALIRVKAFRHFRSVHELRFHARLH